MAATPSSYRILSASFNQDNSCFAIGTRDGIKIFDCDSGRLLYERVVGAFIIVEMLYTSNLLAIVGAGEQPSLSPRILCLFNILDGTALQELNFLTSILAVRLNRKRLIVVLQDQAYIYDVNSLEKKQVIDTAPNSKGLCAFSTSLDGPYLALPASMKKGSVLVYNVMDLQSHCEIDAHRSPLAVMAFSASGMYLATASEKGTIIRVHPVSKATKAYSFRRGTYPSTIFSLSFSPSADLPGILLATSDSGSVHIFSLGLDQNEGIRKPSNFLGSIVPGSVYDALDPTHHMVFHHASPAGIKSHAVIRKLEKSNGTLNHDGSVTLRAIVSIITLNGHFQEYSFSINQKSEAKWSLEHDFNLLTDSAEQTANLVV